MTSPDQGGSGAGSTVETVKQDHVRELVCGRNWDHYCTEEPERAQCREDRLDWPCPTIRLCAALEAAQGEYDRGWTDGYGEKNRVRSELARAEHDRDEWRARAEVKDAQLQQAQARLQATQRVVADLLACHRSEHDHTYNREPDCFTRLDAAQAAGDGEGVEE